MVQVEKDGFSRTGAGSIVQAKVSTNPPAVEVGSNFRYMGIPLSKEQHMIDPAQVQLNPSDHPSMIHPSPSNMS